MKLIDANVILRFLLKDNTEQAEIAKDVIKKGACTRTEVIAEVTYVLDSVYNMKRTDTYKCLVAILDLVRVEDKKAIKEALEIYRDSTLDFVDCVLIGRNHILKEEVFSFDKKLNNRLNKA